MLGKTQAEVKEKLKKAIEENMGIDYGKAKTYTVGSWLEVWTEKMDDGELFVICMMPCLTGEYIHRTP